MDESHLLLSINILSLEGFDKKLQLKEDSWLAAEKLSRTTTETPLLFET